MNVEEVHLDNGHPVFGGTPKVHIDVHKTYCRIMMPTQDVSFNLPKGLLPISSVSNYSHTEELEVKQDHQVYFERLRKKLETCPEGTLHQEDWQGQTGKVATV